MNAKYTYAFEQHKNGTVTCFLSFGDHKLHKTFSSKEEANAGLKKAIEMYRKVAKEMDLQIQEIVLETPNPFVKALKDSFERFRGGGIVDALEQMESDNPSPKYCIEPHGPDGQLALYVGRSRLAHGARICNINDIDQKLWPAIQTKILNVLNGKE